MPLSHLFKSKQELEADQKRIQKKELREANRSCERLQANLEQQALDLQSQIKAAAKKNDTALAKTLAKQLIKVRAEREKAMGAKSKISSIANHASSIQFNQKIAGIMGTSTAALAKVNQQMQPEKLAQQMSQFQAETTKMDMKESAMNDMFEELFDGESEEADAIMNQVLDELAIDTSASMSTVPTYSKIKVDSSQSIKQSVKDGVLDNL